MNDTDDLLYSDEALKTRHLYYQGLNDFNLFVEDKDKEYLYETVFKRLLGNNYSIVAITGLGGKPQVIECFKEFGDQTDGVKNFYLVDGDFDRYIYADKMIQNPCFIYLKTYNIENYLIDENACMQFVKGRLQILDNFVKEKLNFQYWKNRIVSEAAKLFLCYCFLKKYYPTQKSVSRSSYLFIDNKTGFERSDGAYQKYWESIIELDIDAEKKILEIDAIYKKENGHNYFNLICGKFLLDSLYCYIRKIIKSKFNKEDFKFHLVNHFDISKLNYLKEAILLNL
ncbi:MAG: DUF4435 domain-containing protein [Eubacterium sp.]|nr:DUF4435 domain-containing protein [Eubacterium sp.]